MPTIPLLEAIVGSMGMPNRPRGPSWQMPLSPEEQARVDGELAAINAADMRQGAAGARMNPSAPGFGVAPVGPAVSRAQALQGAERDYAAQASRDLGLDVLPVTKSWVDSTGTTPVQLPNGKVMLVGPKASPEPNPGMNFRDWDSLRRQQPGFESTRRLGQESQQRVNAQNAATLATSALDRAAKRAVIAADPRQAKVNDLAAAEAQQRSYNKNPQGMLLQALGKGGEGGMPSPQLAALNPQLYAQLSDAHLKGQEIKGRIEAAGLEGNKQMMPMLVAAYANILSTRGKEEADNALSTLLARFGVAQPSGLEPGQASVAPVGGPGLVKSLEGTQKALTKVAPVLTAVGADEKTTLPALSDLVGKNFGKMNEQELEGIANYIASREQTDPGFAVNQPHAGKWALDALKSAAPGGRKAALAAALAAYKAAVAKGKNEMPVGGFPAL